MTILYEIDKLQRLILGRTGEAYAETIEIDISPWRKKWPGCPIAIFAQRFHEETVYVAAAETENDVLIWNISATDVAVEGIGFAEIRAYEADTHSLKKTRTISTLVLGSLSGEVNEHAPDPFRSWENRLALAESRTLSAIAQAQLAAGKIVELNNELIRSDKLKTEETDEGHVRLYGGSSSMPSIYPIGSYFITEMDINPGVLYGGTWEKVEDRILVGAGEQFVAGTTGGSKDVMIGIDQIPKEGS